MTRLYRMLFIPARVHFFFLTVPASCGRKMGSTPVSAQKFTGMFIMMLFFPADI